MGREIKFRAFTKKHNCWRILDLSNCQGFGRDLLSLLASDEWYFPYDSPLFQYTGLKDKSGQPVYEGDIVEYFHWCHASEGLERSSGKGKIQKSFTNAHGDSWIDNWNPLVGVVKWNEELLTYEPLIDMGEEGVFSFGAICRGGEDYLQYPAPYFEVIGNVYENPNLVPRNNGA